jgi:hypothetical protein
MSLVLAEVFFNNTSSRHNKDLTDFLARNIRQAITKGRMKFRFKVSRVNDLDYLRSIGIKKLPAMIISGKQFIGVPIIVDEIQKRIRTSTVFAKTKSEDEVLNEYFKSELGNPAKDGDGKFDISRLDQEDDQGKVDYHARVHAEMERRKGGEGKDNLQYARERQVPPPKASRMPEKDDNYDNRDQYRRPTYDQPRQPPPRHDNVGEAGDPFDALKKVQAMHGQTDDDKLVAMMLDKSGGA